MAEPNSLEIADVQVVVYEQPLNERIRAFLRLEYLLQMVAVNSADPSPLSSHAAIAALIDIAELLQRADMKSDLVKELERQAVTLSHLASNPQVDTHALQQVLTRLRSLASELKDLRQLGQAVRNDELIAAVRQRIVIAGGTSNFDLPSYHYWLHRPATERQRRLQRWRSELATVEAALAEIVGAIRNSAYPVAAVAKGGMYQKAFEPAGSYQLVRVVVPRTVAVFPEISAGRHRFSLRFMAIPADGGRPTPATEDVDFELHCCML